MARKTTTGLRNCLSGLLALVVALTGAAHAVAGPSDTALPTFSGGGAAVHAYTAVGVIKNNDVETVFMCTNVDTGPINIGVEVFDAAGVLANSVNAGNGAILAVAVGSTVSFGTSGTPLLTEDTTITALPNLKNGSGRVVASTKNVACTAIVLDELHAVIDPAFSNSPPPTAVSLPLIRVP